MSFAALPMGIANRWLRALLALAAGLASAAVAGAGAWGLLARGVREWESGAFAASAEAVLVVLVAVVVGSVALVLAWRWLLGAPLEQAEWTLSFPEGALEGAPRLGQLLAPLEALGYRLRAYRADDAGRRGPAMEAADPLGGGPIEVVCGDEAAAGGRRARAVLRIPAPRPGASALGFLDVYGTLEGRHHELGGYLIATLGRLYPGLCYKRLDSGLSEERADELWQQLPERPQRLHRGP